MKGGARRPRLRPRKAPRPHTQTPPRRPWPHAGETCRRLVPAAAAAAAAFIRRARVFPGQTAKQRPFRALRQTRGETGPPGPSRSGRTGNGRTGIPAHTDVCGQGAVHTGRRAHMNRAPCTHGRRYRLGQDREGGGGVRAWVGWVDDVHLGGGEGADAAEVGQVEAVAHLEAADTEKRLRLTQQMLSGGEERVRCNGR